MRDCWRQLGTGVASRLIPPPPLMFWLDRYHSTPKCLYCNELTNVDDITVTIKAPPIMLTTAVWHKEASYCMQKAQEHPTLTTLDLRLTKQNAAL